MAALVIHVLVLAVAWTTAHAQLPEEVTLHPVVCGSRFTDPASSALLCDVVLQGEVRNVRQASPLAPLLYRASVSVQKVYKGMSMLQHDSSFDDEGQAIESLEVEIEKFGPNENGESCVAKVNPDNTYLFFLSPVNNSIEYEVGNGRRMPLLVNTAMPKHMDLQVVRQVKKALCEGCPQAPVINRVRCKHCAAKPIMKKEMSKTGNKTVNAGKKLTLRCVARGSPSPMYTWVKDGRMLHSTAEAPASGSGGSGGARTTTTQSSVFRDGSLTIRQDKRYSLLAVNDVSAEDEGTYRCLATNAMGEAEQVVHVVVKGDRSQRPSPTTTQPSPSSTEPVKVMTFPDPCKFEPCFHGGTCVVDDSSPGGFVCACSDRYHGNKCQFRKRRVEETTTTVDDNETLLQPDLRRPGASENNDDDDDDNDDERAPGANGDDEDGSDHLEESDHNVDVTDNNNNALDNENANGVSDNDQSLNTGRSDNDFSQESTSLKTGKRRKYKSKDRTESVEGKEGKSGAPQLKISECPDQSYCQNGGLCKIVVKINRKFCECPTGFVGRHCERAI